MNKLAFGTYPYTYVRTVVMRSLLFKKEDYHKMLKMGFNELARYLQESPYKDDINRLASSYSGAELVEHALTQNLVRSLDKLKVVSEGNLHILIMEYLKRYDVQNIKTILRALYINDKDVTFLPLGTLSIDMLQDLLKKASIGEILSNMKMARFKNLSEMIRSFQSTNSLMEIENALDKWYYSGLVEFIGSLPDETSLFKDFLESEIETLNIITLLKLFKNNLSGADVKKYIIKTFSIDRKFNLLMESRNLEDFIQRLEKSRLGRIVKAGIAEYRQSGSLTGIEHDLYSNLLSKTLLLQHQHPLSVEVIIGFMFAKEVETKNIFALVKGKQMGLSEELVEQHLVV